MSSTLSHASASTPCTRAERIAKNIALSDAAPARRYGACAPTVRKWRKRNSTADRSHRSPTLHGALSVAQKAVAVEIRRTLWLPLDDLLLLVREFLKPAVSRSGLAHCIRSYEWVIRPVEHKNAPIVRETFKDYEPGAVHVDIRYQPPMADKSATRYRCVTARDNPVDFATRWTPWRIHADHREVSGTDILRRLSVTAPMKIEKWLTDEGSQFTDRFTDMSKAALDRRASERECALPDIEHRLIQPDQPPTNGMPERFNGRISKFMATTQFRSREDRQTTIESYLKPCNRHLLPQSIGDKAPPPAMRAARKQQSDLSIRRPKIQTSQDIKKMGDQHAPEKRI